MAGKIIPLEMVRTIASSVMKSRSELATKAGITFEGSRDTYKFLGYKKNLEYSDYYDRYDRGGIATRLVDAYPQATWRGKPELLDPDAQEGDEPSQFIRDFNDMAKRLRLYHYFERADKLAGIGRYSILLIGTRGRSRLENPPSSVRSLDDILFLSPFSEDNAQIEECEERASSPRFGRPTFYSIRFENKGSFNRVHHSRVIHISEGMLQDEIYGKPRLESVWNYLDDLDKVIGGSSEAVWRTADRGIHFNVDKELTLQDEDETALEETIDDFVHKLERFIVTRGVESNVLGSEVAQIKTQFDALIALIAGTLGYPARILIGSERGQLASSSDEKNFSARVKERQTSYAEPIMLSAFINQLEGYGIEIPGYKVRWPDVTTLSDKDKADIAARYGQAINHVSKQEEGRVVMSPDDFRRRFIDE